MTKPIIRIHDVTTNEVIDREMTDAEYEAYQAQQAIDAAEAQAQADALAAKEATQAKLLALGLTEDDLIAMGLIGPKVKDVIHTHNEA
jgi:regulator of protease activity HflC (stomatin/prohibitin superfamily)